MRIWVAVDFIKGKSNIWKQDKQVRWRIIPQIHSKEPRLEIMSLIFESPLSFIENPRLPFFLTIVLFD